jgi:Flp pilus assembly pilin Flp
LESNVKRRLWRLVTDDEGQDLIEYALLGTTIAFAAVVAVDLLSDAMGATYESWDEAVQSDDLVEVPDPTPIP